LPAGEPSICIRAQLTYRGEHVNAGSTDDPTQCWARVKGFVLEPARERGKAWSPRQESNLYLALRRHLFYPLNYGEDLLTGR
jgi:hypothetical protein